MHDTRKSAFLLRMAVIGAVLFSCHSLLLAQATTTSQNKATSVVSPQYEVGAFGGGQFWKLQHANAPAPNKLVDGGVFGLRFSQDIWQYIGLEESWSTYGVNNLRTSLTPGTPNATTSFGARNMQFMVGPLFYFTPRTSRVRPFVTAGPAVQYFYPTSDAQTEATANSQLNASHITGSYGPALVFGGGVKGYLTPHLDFRIDLRGIWAENPHFALSGAPAGPGSVVISSGGTQLGSQITLGLGYRWGGREEAVPPQTKACPDGSTVPVGQECPPLPKKEMTVSLSAPEKEVCPGTLVKVTPSTNLPAGTTATYQWTVNGQPISQAETFDFGTTGRDAGTYNIGLTVESPNYNPGTASIAITVREYRPPSGTVEAQPSEIWLGEKSTLTANLTGQCGGTIQAPVFSASEGTVEGNTFDSSGVQFDPSIRTEQRKNVTITATARDNRGQGSATTTIVVKKKAALNAERLPDIVFPRNNARVNNCGKRVLLEELKTYLDKDPTGKVVFIGHVDNNESKASKLDLRRALNAAAVISAGKGICLNFAPSQILISAVGTRQGDAAPQPYFCGTSTTPKTAERSGQAVRASDRRAEYRRVEVWFVPTGGTLPANLQSYQDATAYSVSKLGCPR